jgi:hypothetical protein
MGAVSAMGSVFIIVGIEVSTVGINKGGEGVGGGKDG